MVSNKGADLGLIGSILVILWPAMWFLPIMGSPAAFQNPQKFALAFFPILMGILGVIGVRVGKRGKKSASAILLIIAGIGAITSYFIALIIYIGFSHLFTLIGGILALIGGIMVLVPEGGEELTVGESEKIRNYFSDRMEEIKEGSYVPTYKQIKELPEFSGINRETFRIARRRWYKQNFHMPFVKFTARLEKVQRNKQNQ